MMQMLASLAFSGAAFAASATIYTSVAPQWRRILRLAAGHPEIAFAPLSQLVEAEGRIAVRRSSPISRPAIGWREAA